MITFEKGIKILAIGAHPDDIELSCGGSLLRFRDQFQAKIYTLICSKGELKSDPNVRVREQKEAVGQLGVSESVLLDNEDGSISANSFLVSEIEKHIEKWHPDIVFTHCTSDIHQDHRNVGWATLSAARRAKLAILFYPSLFIRERFVSNIFIDISNYFDEKKKLLAIFKSQASNEYMQPELITAQAREAGLHGGCEYAEQFSLNFWTL